MAITKATLMAEIADLQRIVDTQQATVSLAGERERAALDQLKHVQAVSQKEFERVANEANLRIAAANADGNLLRDAIRQAELTIARMRGYLEGLDEAKPPVMIPAEREYPLAKFPDLDRVENYRGWRDQAASNIKPWWHHNA